MSDIIRYHMMWNKDEDGSIYVSPWPCVRSGDWVKYEDYARLKAEVERLRAASFVTAVPVEQYERVVKAGDDVFCIACNAPSSEGRQKVLQAWQAAKEGKPSV